MFLPADGGNTDGGNSVPADGGSSGNSVPSC